MTLPFRCDRSPRVSVVVPAFNAERTLTAALASVFAQTYEDFEVIVVDDGSTDGTRESAAPWRDRISYVYQANAGPARARNAGIARARGELIAFLDADDVWLPDKLARQTEYFDLFAETGLLHTAAFVCKDGEVPSRSGAQCHYPLSPPRHLFCEIYESSVVVNTLTVMVSRTALDTAGVFDERREVHVEDWDLWLRIASHFPVGYLSCPLAVHRPGGGMSSALERTFAGQLLVLEKLLPAYRAACQARGRNWARGARVPLHGYAADLGHSYFERTELRAARRAFRLALRHDPWRLRTHLYHLASYLPSGVVDAVRARKRKGAPTQERTRIVPEAPFPVERPRRAQLAQDTLFRRARRGLAERAHALDALASNTRGARRRVLFEAASPLSFVVFKSVHARLSRDPRIEFCFTSTSRSWPAETIFSIVGITDGVIPSAEASWMRFDACISTDFYEMTWLHRRTVRLQLFHGVAGKYGIDAPVHVAPDIAEFAGFLFPNLDRLRRYVEAGLVGERSALLVGYPKVDCLLDGSLDRRAIAEDLELRPDIPTVLYAPTWSPDSSLHSMGDEVIRTLASTGFNVLVKLHDRSYDLTGRASGGIDWTTRLSVYDGHERVRVVRDADASRYLMVADALVTDHSSIGFEYALLDRPIVVLDAPRLVAHAHISPQKVAMLRAAAEVIRTPRDLESAIVSQLADSGRHELARRRIADEMFYRPGTATDRAVAVVYDALRLEPAAQPQALPVQVPVAAALASDRKAS